MRKINKISLLMALSVGTAVFAGVPWQNDEPRKAADASPLGVDRSCDAPLPPGGRSEHAPGPERAAGDVTVYGVMMSNGSYESPTVASFDLSGDFNLQKYYTESGLAHNRGGFYTPDGCYYAFNSKEMIKFDANDLGAGIVSRTTLGSSLGYPSAVTYDPVAGKAIGCFENYPGWADYYVLASVDLETGALTEIKRLPGTASHKSYGMAADNKGNVYMIFKYDTQNPSNFYPALYKVDTASGDLTYIGNTQTNLMGSYYGATIDNSTGKMYWMVDATYNSGVLYEVDLTTAECTPVLTTPGKEQFASIYIPYEMVDGSAPAKLADLAVTFADADGNGSVTFTTPVETYEGSPLEGDVAYTVAVGDQTLAEGSAAPGQAVSEDIHVTAAGDVTLTVTLRGGVNNAESGNSISTFVGEDTPSAATGILGEADGNEVTVTWTAPTVGVNGGYIDVSSLRYKVTLQPGDIAVADGTSGTSVSFTAGFERPTSVYAEVTPVTSSATGVTAASGRFIAGPAFETPYAQDFTDDDSMELFTVADIHGDGATWHRYAGGSDAYAQCEYSASNPKDDWLFTPGIRLEQGQQYTLSFKASSLMVRKFPEQLEVMMGEAPAVEAMTITLLPAQKVDNQESWAWFDYSLTLTVERTADYHLGFHAMTPEADMFRLAVDDIRIEGSPVKAPAPVSDITAIPAPWGVHNATLRFRTPALANDGTELTGLLNAEVFVNNRLFKTIEAPAAGAVQTLTIETAEGVNQIDIHTANEAGRSIAARASVFTGADVPGRPLNVRARYDGQNVTVTWDDPEGEHGGMLDTDELNYWIGRSANGELTEIISLTLGKVNEYVDAVEYDEQTPVVYYVAAENAQGLGSSATSNTVFAGGTPHALPFAETFLSGFSAYSTWMNQVVDQRGLAAWTMWDSELDGDVGPQDGDRGAVCFRPQTAGDMTRLFTGNIDLSEARHPVLTFWYRGKGSAGQKLAVEANGDSGVWETLAEITLGDESEEWTMVSLPLNRYNMCPVFNLSFRGEAAAGLGNIYLDNISLRETFDHDLSVALAARKNHYVGQPETLTATVTNMGEKTAGAYTVEFYADDTLLASAERSGLEPYKTEAVTADHLIDLGYPDSSELSAKVVYDMDQNRGNNVSSAATRNHLPLYPAPRDLTATDNGSNWTLAWTEPEAWTDPVPQEVTDDFESYEPFIIDEIGDWTTVDVDGEQGTFGIIGFHYPHREEAKSWQVFNLWALGIEMADDEVTWRPSSGHQMLVAFADKDRRNDDWLISPVLSGEAQTVSFMTRSLNEFQYGEETYEVYASTTGRELSDFSLVYSGSAHREWSETSVELPQGTRYFAIKCTSEGYKFAMALDDITYTPGTGMPADIELKGYNIYRNRTRTNDALVETATAAVSETEAATYAVTAVYSTGESRFSNMVDKAVPSAIDGISAGDGATVRVEGRDIVVACGESDGVVIYGADGIRSFEGTGPARHTAAPGVHIVEVAGNAVKVMVR